ncbi:MAG: hypothetical protein M3Y58_12340 [Chloroflexota bacterium]|nr:hypothetical protein [Chloroflexota bacterium]
MAGRIGMEQAEWSKWETGKRREAKPEQLKSFAHAVSVPVTTMALAYAGIWPPDVSGDASDAETGLIIERYRTLGLTPDVRYDELLMLKHLFRGIRGYQKEAKEDQFGAGDSLAILPADKPGRERVG